MESQFLPKVQFDLLYNNSKDFVFFLEKEKENYKYIYVNNSAQHLLSGNVVGKYLTDIMPKSQYQTIIDNINRAFQTKKQVDYQDYIFYLSKLRKYDSAVIPIFHQNHIYILMVIKEISLEDSKDLKNHYTFMQSVLSNTLLSTILISHDGRLLEANHQFLNDFNITIDGVKDHYFFNLSIIDPKNEGKFKSYFESACEGKTISSDSLTFIDSKGNLRSFTGTFTPLLQKNNKVEAVFIILQEITHYIQQKKALKSTSNGLYNFKHAINSASEVSVTDINGIIIEVNDRFVERTQFSREELIGNTHGIINSRYHSKEFFENLWGTIKSGKVWRGEVCNRSKYGVPYWVDTTIIPQCDEEGNIQQFFSIHFDISEKKRMLTELRNIELMFKMITENTNDLIVITNEDGIILYVSSAYDRKLGYKKDELLGQFYSKLLSKESKDIWNDELFNLDNCGNSKIELIHESKNGDVLWTECNYTVVKDYTRKQGTQIIMVAREITERKEFENKLLFLAYHDTLTQLPNRRYIQKEFPNLTEEANTKKESIAILYVDGDNFKDVNDHFGHEVGDEFINQFGKALTYSVRSNDLVVRFGGDEFVVILTGLNRNEIERKAQVDQIISRIKQNLLKGWTIANHLFTPTASIGISFYPDHGKNLDDLLELSDKALYDIKLSTKDNFKIYHDNKVRK